MELLTPNTGLVIWQVLIFLLMIVTILFAGYTIFKIIKQDKEESKALWILLVLFFPILGSIIYWFNHNNNRKKTI